MKIKSLFIAGMAILAFSACDKKKDVEPINGGTGTTFASMQISTKLATRALEDGQADHNGKDAENTLGKLKLISSLSPETEWNLAAPAATTLADGEFWKVGTTDVYKTAPVKVNPGMQTMALIFNPGTLALGNAINTKTHQYTGSVTALSTDDNFVMTSAAFKKDVKDNISKTDNEATTAGDAQNAFKDIAVERVVVKGIVREGAAFTNIVMQGTTQIGTVEDLKFAAVNGATKTFLYGDNAGARQMDVTDPNPYTGFESAIHGIAPALTAADALANGLVRLGNDPTATENQAQEINASGVGVDAAKAFYFMENSGNLNTGKNKAHGYYRFAYAKVYLKYTPNKLLDLKITPAVPATGTEPEKPEVKELVEVTAPTNTDGTFYKGEKDNLLYTTKAAAAESVVAKGQNAYTYVEGKAGYRALWNRQALDPVAAGDEKGKVVVNADARRNNIYMLDIDKIGGLGFPWDPSDPKDPNLTRPDDDPEPKPGEGPDNPSIEETETYMSVQSKVLPWNLVERKAITL